MIDNYIQRLAVESWYSKKGLVLSCIVLISACLFYLPHTLEYFGLTLIFVVLVVILWVSTNAIPKVSKGRLGFVVSIYCSDVEEAKRINEDFIVPLKRLVVECSREIEFIELPQRFAKKLDTVEDAKRIRRKMNASFIIFGGAKVRKLDGKDMHILNLRGLVGHAQVSESLSLKFEKEFSELFFPKTLRIDHENDLLSFEFTSEWAGVVAHYIIAIAATISKDTDFALKLYSRTQELLEKKNSNFEVFRQIASRIPKHVEEIRIARAEYWYRSWISTKNEDDLNRFFAEMSCVDFEQSSLKPKTASFSAIYIFWKDRDIGLAKALMNKWPGRHPLKLYSLAFLTAYEGDLQTAYKLYTRQGQGLLEEEYEQIANIEDFIVEVIRQEPQKGQLYYLLGLLNKLIKHDRISAIRDFRLFIKNTDASEYRVQHDFAERSIKELSNSP